MRDFLECYERKSGSISIYQDGKSKFEFNIKNVNNGTPFYFNERSFTFAEELLNDAQENQNEKVQHVVKQGVVLGKFRNMSGKDTTVIADIRRYIRARFGVHNLDEVSVFEDVKNVVCFDQFGEAMKICKLDTVKIDSTDMTELTEEWIMEIEQIIQVDPFQGCFYTFVNGKYYIPAFQNGQVALHQWTQTPKFIPPAYARDSVQPISTVRPKVIMYIQNQEMWTTQVTFFALTLKIQSWYSLYRFLFILKSEIQ